MLDDYQLQLAVLAELNWEPSVTASHISVRVDNGFVTLTGHVENLAQRHAAMATACRVKGVKAATDDIEVRLPFEAMRADDEISAAAIDRLVWDVAVPHRAVNVAGKKGWVTLSGQVAWNYQREAAEQDVQRLFGVVGVSNRIIIKPTVDASVISDDIMHALHRSWFFDPKTVTVTTESGRVWLTGTVPSLHDLQLAAATAWAAPGVTAVKNDIAIV
jgi:osmotically-inducible protein OsmY